MDFFADIAKSGIKGRLEKLIVPTPIPFEEKLTKLRPCSNEAGAKVAPKINTKEELDKILQAEREKYAPYLQSYAPKITTTREITYIENFDYWTQDDTKKTKVTIPHYGGPLGNATAFYESNFEIKKLKENKKVFITLKGADYKAKIFINQRFVGQHEGFFATFFFDITKYIQIGENVLTIELDNDYVMLGSISEKSDDKMFGDKIYAATGPGYDDAQYGWHHCPPGMGLFDKVYIEIKDSIFVNDIFTRTLENEVEVWAEVYNCNYELEEISLNVSCYGENVKQTVFEDKKIELYTGKQIGLGDTFTEVLSRMDNTINKELPLFAAKGKNRYKFTISSDDMKLWSPTSPNLYQLQITVCDKAGNKRDSFVSNFGIRTFTQDIQSETKGMFYLNKEEIRLRGANTMGFEQQDVMRGDFDQLIDDILLAKICNMNFLRITQRPVQQEVYDYCDKLGLLIQTDLPLFGCLRRQQFCEAVRQAEEMELHVRKHPCVILITYINEPFPNAHNLPNMNLERNELEQFFKAADIVVLMANPDRVIKYVDGDYDPPSEKMPDNHCYPMWYNAHGIDIGRLNKGYWMPVLPNWYYGCGEFGCEGLEDVQTMLKHYPESWTKLDEHGGWCSDNIIKAQTKDFYHYFYPKQETMEAWVNESQKFQALATKLMTEAFRRDNRMITFAIHLFIDAFPSGWMKTIMDCDRNPKAAYFAYKNALEPIMISLRTDKYSYVCGEEMRIETHICNDTAKMYNNATIQYELYNQEDMIYSGSSPASIEKNTAQYSTTAFLEMPQIKERQELKLRAVLLDQGNILTYNEIELTLLPAVPIDLQNLIIKDIGDISKEDIARVYDGGILFANITENKSYVVDGTEVISKDSSMSPMHFASCKTGHEWVRNFKPYDFRMWYDGEVDMITPLTTGTFIANGYQHVLISRNLDNDGKLREEAIIAEKTTGKGKIVISQINFDRIYNNGFGRILIDTIQQPKEL